MSEQGRKVEVDVHGSMGLKGIWSQIANLSAVVVVCVLFWQSQQVDRIEAREDRKMFRDEMSNLHRAGLVRDQVLVHNQDLLQELLRRMEVTEELQRQTVQALRDVARCLKPRLEDDK